MKIATDVNYAGIRSAGTVLSRTQNSPSSNDITAQNNHDVSARIQRDRAIIDALAIAQASRELVQKAIDISARLRSIASQALTTGNINMQELGNEVAGIQNTMKTYGETVSIPVSDNTSGNKTDDDTEGFYNNTRDMLSTAEDMLAGKRVEPERINRITQQLAGIAEHTDARINEIASQLGVTGKQIHSGSYKTSLNEITSSITGNPEMSITAQGNIPPDVVKTLTAV